MLQLLKPDQFDEFFKILSEAFPKAEYRPYEKQLALLNLPYYKIYTYEQDAKIAAFFAVWEGPSFVFIEHFAVKEAFRNGGIGAQLLQAFTQLQNKPIILESEDPTTEIQRRRIAFYERNAFFKNEFGYLQPVLTEGETTVPLILMTYPAILDEVTFKEFKTWVFEKVYGVGEE